MSDRDSKFVNAALYGFIGAAIGVTITAYLVFATGLVTAESQTIVQKEYALVLFSEEWWREWVGALSGWVAALVAGFVGWTTLRPLMQQAMEPRNRALLEAYSEEEQNLNVFIEGTRELFKERGVLFLEPRADRISNAKHTGHAYKADGLAQQLDDRRKFIEFYEQFIILFNRYKDARYQIKQLVEIFDFKILYCDQITVENGVLVVKYDLPEDGKIYSPSKFDEKSSAISGMVNCYKTAICRRHFLREKLPEIRARLYS